jgi:hypothetical protein
VKFYLGIHMANWLARPELADVPVFVSRRVFPKRTLPRAVGSYAIDSGGFTELQKYGRWTITPAQYVAFLRRCWDEVGPFDFAAPMDWMCEPAVINGGWFNGQHFVGTKLPLRWHQRQTVRNYIQLRDLAPDLPIIPVIQGWRETDYLRCADMYTDAGVDLAAAPLVGLGSVCRRQNTTEAAHIIDALREHGVSSLHGFGFKVEGLRACWYQLATADSLSWSKDGRHRPPCIHPPYARGKPPKNEANCLPYALDWRQRHIRAPRGRRQPTRQLELFPTEVAA